jgi:hypothetical protein
VADAPAVQVRHRLTRTYMKNVFVFILCVYIYSGHGGRCPGCAGTPLPENLFNAPAVQVRHRLTHPDIHTGIYIHTDVHRYTLFIYANMVKYANMDRSLTHVRVLLSLYIIIRYRDIDVIELHKRK